MEQLLLRLLPAGEELYVVHQEDVAFAEEGGELPDVAVLEGVHEHHAELLGRGVDHDAFGVVFQDVVAYGLEQVRFAQTRPAVDEQGVEVGLARGGGHGFGRAVGEFVACTDHELVEREVFVEPGERPLRLHGGCVTYGLSWFRVRIIKNIN